MSAFLGVSYIKHPSKSFHSLQLKCSYRSATASYCSLFSTLHWRNFHFLVPREARRFAAIYMAVGKTTCLCRLYPFFALFCIWMRSQIIICLLVLVAVLGGLIYRLSSKLVSLWDYMERKCECCISLFGIYLMKKNLFALIWSGNTGLAGIWRNWVSVNLQNNTEIRSYCKASHFMSF